jgi:hypothetical protein
LTVTPTNGTITPNGKEFTLVPGSGNTCMVSVSLDGKPMGGLSFRVKNLPPPTPVVEGITGRTTTKGELMASQGLLTDMRDFEFKISYTITSFTILVNTGGGYFKEETSNSQYFTETQKQLFNQVRTGQRVSFTDIKAKGPTGEIQLSDLSLKIK